MTRVSKRFKSELKTAERPAYQIAHQAGINPSTLSKLICGIERPKPNDRRILAVGAVLGLSADQCFEFESSAA